MPPSRYLGLPWPEWGETDQFLTRALDALTASVCPCGCGHWRSDTLDPATAGRWQVSIERCQARAALEDYRASHEPDPGELIGVHLLPEGEVASDPLEFDPAAAAEAHAEHMRRFGLTN